MYILFFLILFVQFVVYWIFEPSVAFLTNIIEVKSLPIIFLTLTLFLFSAKENT